MGNVTEHLVSQIQTQVEKKGIVVWYDPDNAYAKMIQDFELGEIPILKFEDSYLRLRRNADQYLEFVKPDGKPRHDCSVPPKLLVYVPKDRRETNHALVELETAGVIMEPGGRSLPLNTRLRVVADQVFKKIAPDSVHDIARQVESGLLNLEDLDRMAEEAGSLSTALIKLIFKTTSATDVALEFGATDTHDEEIQNKKAMSELAGLFRSELGIELDPDSAPHSARQDLRRILLVTDLVGHLKSDDTPAQISSVPIPNNEVHIEKVQNVCRVWRDRGEYREAYEEAAIDVEEETGLAGLDFETGNLVELKTFPFIERFLLVHAEQRILDGQSSEALELARKRKNSFWSLQDQTNQLRWTLLEDVARILELSAQIISDLKTIEKSPAVMVQSYSNEPSPWCLLDTHYRHLETKYSTFDLELGREHRKLEQVIAFVRQNYTKTVERCIEVFAAAMEEAGFQIEEHFSQDEIYQERVHSRLSDGDKIAYVLVDALRYEMGRELVDGLTEEFKTKLDAGVALLPSITSIGMAALMPGADKGMELAETTGGKIALTLGSSTLKDRASRVKYINQTLADEVTVLKLNGLMKPSEKTKKEIKAAKIILVTSQEIDRWGEEGEEEEARIFMDEVLDKLRKGIRRLGSLGVVRLIVTSDHGHLFGETISSGMKMDPPGGKTVELHRRVWIGRGGKKGDGYLRVSASQLGLGGDLDLAFPRSLSCFKSGGSASYFHGGISLQEMVIPIIELKTKKIHKKPDSTIRIDLKIGKPKISNRFFSVTALLTWDGMFGPQKVRVRLEVKAGRKVAGVAAMAAYGFEEGTKEIVLEKDKENPITLMLSETDVESVSIRLLDAGSQVEVARLDNIPVSISI